MKINIQDCQNNNIYIPIEAEVNICSTHSSNIYFYDKTGKIIRTQTEENYTAEDIKYNSNVENKDYAVDVNSDVENNSTKGYKHELAELHKEIKNKGKEILSFNHGLFNFLNEHETIKADEFTKNELIANVIAWFNHVENYPVRYLSDYLDVNSAIVDTCEESLESQISPDVLCMIEKFKKLKRYEHFSNNYYSEILVFNCHQIKSDVLSVLEKNSKDSKVYHFLEKYLQSELIIFDKILGQNREYNYYLI